MTRPESTSRGWLITLWATLLGHVALSIIPMSTALLPDGQFDSELWRERIGYVYSAINAVSIALTVLSIVALVMLSLRQRFQNTRAIDRALGVFFVLMALLVVWGQLMNVYWIATRFEGDVIRWSEPKLLLSFGLAAVNAVIALALGAAFFFDRGALKTFVVIWALLQMSFLALSIASNLGLRQLDIAVAPGPIMSPDRLVWLAFITVLLVYVFRWRTPPRDTGALLADAEPATAE